MAHSLNFKHINRSSNCDLIWCDWWCACRTENGCEKGVVCSLLVFPCGCISLCIHRAACVDSFILKEEIKKQDQQSWSPVDCFIFRFILHYIPPSFPRTCSSSVIWRLRPWELPGLLWSLVLFVSMSMINGEKTSGQTGPERTGS